MFVWQFYDFYDFIKLSSFSNFLLRYDKQEPTKSGLTIVPFSYYNIDFNINNIQIIPIIITWQYLDKVTDQA